MKTMILTGWGWTDYASAAAIALRKFPQAKVRGVSTRRLPEHIESIKDYDQIIILGVGLSGDINLLENALKKKTDCNVIWISTLEPNITLTESVKQMLDIHVYEEAYLTEAVAKHFQVDCKDLFAFLQNKTPCNLHEKYNQLLSAAQYMYRNYQNECFYTLAIKHLALTHHETEWSQNELDIIEHYKRYGNRELIGKSRVITELQEKINLVAAHERARVLIYGESGTGKETVAQQIYNKSPRSKEPCILFNCASVTPNLLESRFFGHEKGAFTGANERKIGLFEQANEGTLFLDEIGELPLEAQAILLRVLEEGRFMRLGGHTEISVNVRLLTATNRDLAAQVRDGSFREDLFYRLNVIQIRIPPLREHKCDITQIANEYWLKNHQQRLTTEQVNALQNYDYPGNVRELLNLLERASVLQENDFSKLLNEHKQIMTSLEKKPIFEYPDNLEEMISLHVRNVHEKYQQNISHTAEKMGLTRNTVRKYLERDESKKKLVYKDKSISD